MSIKGLQRFVSSSRFGQKRVHAAHVAYFEASTLHLPPTSVATRVVESWHHTHHGGDF